jgi:hypothetical protein
LATATIENSNGLRCGQALGEVQTLSLSGAALLTTPPVMNFIDRIADAHDIRDVFELVNESCADFITPGTWSKFHRFSDLIAFSMPVTCRIGWALFPPRLSEVTASVTNAGLPV